MARSWAESGMSPVSAFVDEPGTPRRMATPEDAKYFKPALMPLPCRLVAQFFGIAAECSRGEFDGRPSPRDFDYLMDREGVEPRRRLMLRQLLRARNSESDAIRARRKD